MLIAVYTDIAGRVELHTMVIEKGIMKMRKLEKGISLPSQGHVFLKPGGDHIMFYERRIFQSTTRISKSRKS